MRGPVYTDDCKECPFAKNGAPNKPVAGEGPDKPLWIAVGEGPGSTEVRVGRPFVGPSGQMVNRTLATIREPRENGWVTNATLCVPTPSASDGQKRKARECCAPRLRDELAQFPGIPIVALGGVAAQGFLGDKFSITQLAGSCHEVDVDGSGERAVIPTVHPAAILRGSQGNGSAGGMGGAHSVDMLFWNLVYDIAKIVKLGKGEEVYFSEDIEVETEDAQRAETLIVGIITAARKTRELGVDTETDSDDEEHSALEWTHASLNAIGLAAADRAVSVPWRLMTMRARRFLRAGLGDPGIRKIFHNALYDRPVLARHGFPVAGPFDDTMLAHHSAFPGLAHGLQRVGTQFFLIPPWKAEYRAGDESIEEHCLYNAKDTLVTARLMKPLRTCLARSNAETTYKIDLEMVRIAERMSRVGIPISRAANRDLSERFTREAAIAREKVYSPLEDLEIMQQFKELLAFDQAKTPRKKDAMLTFELRIAERTKELDKALAKKVKQKGSEFDVDSFVHVAAYLRACGIPLTEQTAKGRVSTKRDVLEGMAHHGVVRGLLDYREVTKMLSTFVRSLPHYMDRNDRVHTLWSVHKITGRWGSTNPQMMNWPKANPKKNRPNLRAQVIAPKGRVFVGADFKALEARIIALLSGDPFLLDTFANNRDLHAELARVVWPDFDQLPVDERKTLRDMIKRPEYGAFYGGEDTTLWQAVVRDYPAVTLAQIQKMTSIMRAKMPGVTAWHQRLMTGALQTREVRSAIYGRRRVFPLETPELTEVLNFPVQSTGADLMNTALMRLEPRLPTNSDIILQVHDFVCVECPEDDADKIKEIVIDASTQEQTYNGATVRFDVDCKIGQSWADI